MGYTLNDLIQVADEGRKIRASRRSNMTGTWGKFKNLYESAIPKGLRPSASKNQKPKILVAKSG